jgi:hypothetical protein
MFDAILDYGNRGIGGAENAKPRCGTLGVVSLCRYKDPIHGRGLRRIGEIGCVYLDNAFRSFNGEIADWTPGAQRNLVPARDLKQGCQHASNCSDSDNRYSRHVCSSIRSLQHIETDCHALGNQPRPQ